MNKVFRASLIYLIVTLIYIVIQFGLAIVGQSEQISDAYYFVITTLIIQLGAIFIPAFIYIRSAGAKASGLKSPKLRAMLLVPAMAILSYLIVVFINALSLAVYTALGGQPPQDASLFGELITPERLPMMLLVVALLPGVVEELLFRGALMSAYGESFGRVRGACVSGIAFALMHIGAPYQLPAIFTLGVILGLLRYDTGSVYPGMLFHFFNNAIALVLAAFAGNMAAPVASFNFNPNDFNLGEFDINSLESFMPGMFGIASIVLLPIAAAAAALLYVCWRSLKKRPRDSTALAQEYYETPKPLIKVRPARIPGAKRSLVPLYIGIAIMLVMQVAMVVLAGIASGLAL